MKKPHRIVQRKYEREIIYFNKVGKKEKKRFKKRITKYSSLLHAVRPIAFRIKLRVSAYSTSCPIGLAFLPAYFEVHPVFHVLYLAHCSAHHLLSVPGFLAMAHLVLGSCFPGFVSSCLFVIFTPSLKYKLVEEGEMTFTSFVPG